MTPGALQHGAGDRKLSDRSATEDRHSIGLGNFSKQCAKPGRRENVGDQDRLIVAPLVGQLNHG
jgi:hypothetical protein